MKSSRKKWHKVLILSLVLIFLGGTAAWGICWFATKRAMARAEEQLKKGYGALAVETLDCYRRGLIRRDQGCKLLIEAYFQARRTERLEWASQACLEAGKEFPEAYLGLAAVREWVGRDREAVQILAQAVGKFDQVPDLYYRIGQIFLKNKNDVDAAIALSKAAERGPQNNQLQLEALEVLSRVQKWEEARKFATRLKDVKTESPEVILVIARALQKGGDPLSVEPLLKKAKELISKEPNPQVKAALKKGYSDLLGKE